MYPENLKNSPEIMDYSFPSAAWSEYHSTVALSWPLSLEPGLQYLHSLKTHGGVVVTNNLLNWSLKTSSSIDQPELIERKFYIDKVIESQRVSNIRIEVMYRWIAYNTLGVEFTLSNEGENPWDGEFVFNYEAKSTSLSDLKVVGSSPRVAIEIGRKVRYRPGLQPTMGDPTGSWHGVIDFKEEPDDEVVSSYTIEGKNYPIYCMTDLSLDQIHLKAGESHTLKFPIAFGHSWIRVKDLFDQAKRNWIASNSIRDSGSVEELIAELPDIDSDFSKDDKFQKLYLQAVVGLNSLFISGEGRLTGTKRLPWTCKHVLAGGFFWDTAFSAVGGVLINPEAAMECIELFCSHRNSRGAMPANLTDHALGGEGQFPIMTWGAWNVFTSTLDIEWLKRILPSLETHVEHWFTYFSRTYGVCYIYNSYLGNDDDVRFDYCMKGLYNQPVSNIDSPDINACLVMELSALSRIYKALGNNSKSDEYDKRARVLNQKVVDLFYFKDEHAFLDTDEGSREIKTGVLTPHMFLPLWAGAPIPKKDIDAIIMSHMLDPEKFYREHPFPSVAYNHPEYDPEGYWRGRIWPHMVYWMCQTLWLHGYHEEATHVAKNLLNMMLKTPWICENYNSETGIGWNPETYRGWPGYNWCYSAVILLMTGQYKKPPLPVLEGDDAC